MKNTSLIIAVGALAGVALTTASLQAGPAVGKAPLPPPDMPMDNLLDPIETTLSSGYDTDYMFRGVSFGKDAIWTGLDMSMPVGLPVGNFVANWGFWYINPTDGARGASGVFPAGARGLLDDELDIYASLGTTIGAFDVSVGWTHYSFLDSSGNGVAGPFPFAPALGDQDEFGINIGTTVDTPWIPLDLGFAYYYNTDIGDNNYLQNAGLGHFSGAPGMPVGPVNAFSELEHYFEGSVGTTFEVSDRMALNLGAVGNWYSSNFAGVTFTAAFPIQVAENVVFEPYVSYLLDESSGNLHDGYISPFSAVTQDQFYGGVSLSVSF